MQSQNIDRDDFNFSKSVTTKVEKQINRIDYSSYKKLAFFALAIGVFVSAGVYFGNNVAPVLLKNNHIMEKLVPSKEVLLNLNNQVSSLSSQDFDSTINYYQNIVNMYDNKFDYVNKTLIEYNLQSGFSDATVTQDNFKRMALAINDHKENISEVINRISSLKNKVIAKDSLSYDDAQFVLNSVEKAKQHVIYQNTDVDTQFNKNLVAAPKDVTKYLIKVNAYDKIKAFDDSIKSSFQTTTNTVKPKM